MACAAMAQRPGGGGRGEERRDGEVAPEGSSSRRIPLQVIGGGSGGPAVVSSSQPGPKIAMPRRHAVARNAEAGRKDMEVSPGQGQVNANARAARIQTTRLVGSPRARERVAPGGT